MAILGREIELSLVVLVAGLCIFLGYRLFYIAAEKQGEFSIKTKKDFILKLANVAPGVYFALFGSLILSICVYKGVTDKVTTTTTAAPTAAKDNPSTSNDKEARGFTRTETVHAYVLPRSQASDPASEPGTELPIERTKVYDSLLWYQSIITNLVAQNSSQTIFWRLNVIKQTKQELHGLIPEKPFLLLLDESNSPNDVSIFLATYINYYYNKYSVATMERPSRNDRGRYNGFPRSGTSNGF